MVGNFPRAHVAKALSIVPGSAKGPTGKILIARNAKC